MEQEIPSRAEDEIRQRNAFLKDTNAVVSEEDGKVYVDFENTASNEYLHRRRNMFKIPYGDTLYQVDFNQIEAQCAVVHAAKRAASMKHQAKDRIKRGDIYTNLASRLFGVPEENITQAMRKAAKEKVYWVSYGGKTMNRNQTIKIARAVRNYPGGIAEVTLVWRVFHSKLGVEYRQVTDFGNLQQTIPDWNVKAWLRTFVQGHLQPDSYYLVAPPTETWRNAIEAILRQC